MGPRESKAPWLFACVVQLLLHSYTFCELTQNPKPETLIVIQCTPYSRSGILRYAESTGCWTIVQHRPERAPKLHSGSMSRCQCKLGPSWAHVVPPVQLSPPSPVRVDAEANDSSSERKCSAQSSASKSITFDMTAETDRESDPTHACHTWMPRPPQNAQ